MPTVIDTIGGLQAFLSTIGPSSSLYIDMEGNNLCREGTLLLITILVKPKGTISLIDIKRLGQRAFTTTTWKPPYTTLANILEDKSIPKYLWDVRNKADALKSLHGVGLAGVTDIQLLEAATRSRSRDKTHLRSLASCVWYDVPYYIGREVYDTWVQRKRLVDASMRTEDVFAKRPVSEWIMAYCAGDVQYLPDLRRGYMKKMENLPIGWHVRVRVESERRVREAHAPGYEPNGPGKKLSPWGPGVAEDGDQGRGKVSLEELRAL
jgi:exonuclease 3'-5' domain-containing protein 1